MKKIFIISIFLICFGCIFAQNFSFDGDYDPDVYSTIHYFTINKDKITYKYENKQWNEEITVNYKKNYKDGLLFLEMAEKFPHSIAANSENSSTSNTILVLAGKHVSKDSSKILFSNGPILFFAETAGFEKEDCFITPHINFYDQVSRIYTDCSSWLKEKNNEYKVDNLDNCKPGTPWVEGVKGDGIGEGFTIDNTEGYPYLLIMNGYISYSKPYLYMQNNRVKKIKVTGVESGQSKILNVLDTPHPQTVDISFLTEPEDVRIEIEDVYKGTKYDDTCLNFCITYDNQVIPYENSIDEFSVLDSFDK